MSTQFYNKCGDQKSHEQNHLCQLILKRELGQIRDLVRDSQYFCKNCGRAARDLAHLCNPSKITSGEK